MITMTAKQQIDNHAYILKRTTILPHVGNSLQLLLDNNAQPRYVNVDFMKTVCS